jgi:hypothetical protein
MKTSNEDNRITRDKLLLYLMRDICFDLCGKHDVLIVVQSQQQKFLFLPKKVKIGSVNHVRSDVSVLKNHKIIFLNKNGLTFFRANLEMKVYPSFTIIYGGPFSHLLQRLLGIWTSLTRMILRSSKFFINCSQKNTNQILKNNYHLDSFTKVQFKSLIHAVYYQPIQKR